MKYDSEYFEEQFSHYDDKYGNAWGMNWRAYMHARAEKATGIVKKYIKLYGENCNIFEIGCATGDFIDSYMQELNDYSGELFGTDISSKAIDICKKKYKDYHNMRFEVLELPNIVLGRRFNCILCIDVLEYFDIFGKKACIENMLQFLSDDGHLIIQIPLQGENEEEFIRVVQTCAKINDVQYVYGDIWYNLVEKHLVGWVYILLRDKKMGKIGEAIGKIFFNILKSKKMVNSVFGFNEKFFPNRRSHIIMILERRDN